MESAAQNGQDENVATPTAVARQFIAFALGDREFGVDIMAVREIRGWSGTTPIPNSSPAVLGVVNLRGTIVPVIDLRVCFGIERTDLTRTNVVFIVRIGDRTFGLVVDAVSDILSVKETDIQPIREIEETSQESAVSQIIVLEGRLVGVIDLAKLIGQFLLPAASRKPDALPN